MNGLQLIQAALLEWRKNHGDETLYNKCQWFDGWYVQWAFEGFSTASEKSIEVYRTAQIAADASRMVSGITGVNDPDITTGMRLYFKYAEPGHVVTAVGWDGKRLLVSNTANGGDVVKKLTNNVKIHHADTINLPFIGASRTNGDNKPIVGVTPYVIGTAAVVYPKTRKVRPTIGGLNGRTKPNTKTGQQRTTLTPNKTYTFSGYMKGQRVTVQGITSDIWFKRGNLYYAAAGFTSQATSGLKNLGTYSPTAPKKRKFQVPRNGQVYYRHYNNALNGNHDPRQVLPAGKIYDVVNNPGTGPVKVRVPGVGDVWVGTRNHPAQTYMG